MAPIREWAVVLPLETLTQQVRHLEPSRGPRVHGSMGSMGDEAQGKGTSAHAGTHAVTLPLTIVHND